jgi:hypothetical protein
MGSVRSSTFIWFIGALLLAGCATQPPRGCSDRKFAFEQDTFSFANELVLEYSFDEAGKATVHKREPKPDYTLHCFVVARSSRQFFDHARFDPTLPKTNNAAYRALVRQVISRNSRKCSPPAERIIVPGYSNLREFSRDHEALLKKECGSAIWSYLQRGNWRMVMPFTRGQQQKTAGQLFQSVQQNRPAVVHVVCFPQLSMNHAILLYDARRESNRIHFATYDPNMPARPTELVFDEATRTFTFPRNNYFAGGRVNVYEVYKSICY